MRVVSRRGKDIGSVKDKRFYCMCSAIGLQCQGQICDVNESDDADVDDADDTDDADEERVGGRDDTDDADDGLECSHQPHCSATNLGQCHAVALDVEDMSADGEGVCDITQQESLDDETNDSKNQSMAMP